MDRLVNKQPEDPQTDIKYNAASESKFTSPLMEKLNGLLRRGNGDRNPVEIGCVLQNISQFILQIPELYEDIRLRKIIAILEGIVAENPKAIRTLVCFPAICGCCSFGLGCPFCRTFYKKFGISTNDFPPLSNGAYKILFDSKGSQVGKVFYNDGNEIRVNEGNHCRYGGGCHNQDCRYFHPNQICKINYCDGTSCGNRHTVKKIERSQDKPNRKYIESQTRYFAPPPYFVPPPYFNNLPFVEQFSRMPMEEYEYNVSPHSDLVHGYHDVSDFFSNRYYETDVEYQIDECAQETPSHYSEYFEDFPSIQNHHHQDQNSQDQQARPHRQSRKKQHRKGPNNKNQGKSYFKR